MAIRERSDRKLVLVGTMALLGCLGWAVGCGKGGPPTGGVQGRVTYEGSPVTEGVVSVYSPEMGIGADAKIGADGAYATSEPLRTGKYTVAVLPPPEPPPQDAVPKASTKAYPNIPLKYRDPKKSGLSVTIAEGKNQFDIPMTK